MIRILAAEDSDAKWERVEPVVRSVLKDAEIVRVRDLFEAEREVERGFWSLLLLDISLDIKTASSESMRGAHDHIGGLKLAGRMFYNEREIRTIIITGFDAFPTSRSGTGDDMILGLDDVMREARKFLGKHLVGAVRVGVGDWADLLRKMLEEVKCAS
jgi:hypothetical protein